MKVYADGAPCRIILERCCEPSHRHLSGNTCPCCSAAGILPASQQLSQDNKAPYEKHSCNTNLPTTHCTWETRSLSWIRQTTQPAVIVLNITKNDNFHSETKIRRQRHWREIQVPRFTIKTALARRPRCFILQVLGRVDCILWRGYRSLFSKCPFSITVKGFNIKSMRGKENSPAAEVTSGSDSKAEGDDTLENLHAIIGCQLQATFNT